MMGIWRAIPVEALRVSHVFLPGQLEGRRRREKTPQCEELGE